MDQLYRVTPEHVKTEGNPSSFEMIRSRAPSSVGSMFRDFSEPWPQICFWIIGYQATESDVQEMVSLGLKIGILA